MGEWVSQSEIRNSKFPPVSDTPSDPSLDAMLRSVSVPPELADRVKAALVPSEEQVDGEG